MLIVVSQYFSASHFSVCHFFFLPTLQRATEICNPETALDSPTTVLLNHTFDGKRQSKRFQFSYEDSDMRSSCFHAACFDRRYRLQTKK